MAARLAAVPSEVTRDRQPQRIDPPPLVDRRDGQELRCRCHDRASTPDSRLRHGHFARGPRHDRAVARYGLAVVEGVM